MPCSSMAWSSAKLADRPSEIASRPAACGARLGPGGVGAADDHGEMVERRLVQPVMVKEGVEAALFAVMGNGSAPGMS